MSESALRDGVKLATDVYRPARNGKAVAGRFPVILERTPYGRNVAYFRDITASNATAKTRAEVAGVLRPPRLCRDLPGLSRMS